MGTLNVRTEGGSGGKRAHSGMDHWFYTEEIKDAARVRRRLADQHLSREGIAEHTGTRETNRHTVSPSRRKAKPADLRRDGRHCPVCLARLRRINTRTRRMRCCTHCASHPQPTKVCLHCNQHTLWQGAGLVACQSCGRRGMAAVMIGAAR